MEFTTYAGLPVTATALAQTIDWGVSITQAPLLWHKTKGEGMKIAVLDTGLDHTHPDLKDNVKGGVNFTTGNRNDWMDRQGHGCISPEDTIYTSHAGLQMIQDFYHSFEERNAILDGDSIINDISNKNIFTLAVDEKGRVKKSLIEAVHKIPYNGDVYKLSTREGDLTLTPWHPVYVVTSFHCDRPDNDMVIKKKRADELKIGDNILLPRNQQDLNSVLSVNGFKLSEELSYFAGLVASDGHLMKNQKAIEFFNIDHKLLEVFKDLSLKIFGKKPSVYKDNRSSNSSFFRARLYSSAAYETLQKIGIPPGEKSLTLSFPEMISKSPCSIIASFLAGMLDGDGNITGPKIRLITGSVEFAKSTVMLLRTLGMKSSYHISKESKTGFKNGGKSFQIRIANWPEMTSKLQASRFEEKKPNLVPMKTRKSASVISLKKESYEGFMYDLTVCKYHNYVANAMVVSNTHCAGIISGSDNGQGIVGVAPKAELYGVKVLGDDGRGQIDWIINGINWCVANKMDIISMSLGTSSNPGDDLHRAIKRAREVGVILIAASGNEATHCGWPAAYPEVIAVGAVDPTFEKANYSNFGEEIDVVAGGSEILSTYLDHGYARLSGTSMATPMVTGSVALVQRYARLQEAKVGPVEIMDLLRSRSVGLGGTRLRNDHFGSGLVNVYKLIEKFNENNRN